jgi:hypothetical protein
MDTGLFELLHIDPRKILFRMHVSGALLIIGETSVKQETSGSHSDEKVIY